MELRPIFAAMLLLAPSAWGCSQGTAETASGEVAVTTGEYLLAAEPTGAQGVAQARESVQDGDEIVVTGRIGGDAEPFVDGIAAFTIVDCSLESCAAEEDCPCCSFDKNKAVVKVVDGRGNVVNTDARKLLGVKQSSTVVIQGKAKRDEAGNLTVLARGIHVK